MFTMVLKLSVKGSSVYV